MLQDMRNQITGSLTLDASALAETIAEAVATRLGVPAPAQPASNLAPLEAGEAADVLDAALTNAFGVAVDPEGLQRVIAELDARGYVLARTEQPYPVLDGRPDDWFGNDVPHSS